MPGESERESPARGSSGLLRRARSPGQTLRAVRRRLVGRDEGELEQGYIRVAVVIGMYVYMLLAPFPEETRPRILFWSGLIFLAGITAALFLIVHIRRHPEPVPLRRLLGILVDTTGVNASMLVGGHLATPFYPLLLWLIFGHGFRYGRFYLFVAAVLSLFMFLGVILLSRDWNSYSALDTSLVIALIVLPAYVSVLQGRLAQALARAQEASRVKSRFLAAMSHEFRTPLNAVIGMSELLEHTRLDPPQKQMVATIRSAAHSLLDLVDAILRLSRLESGGLQVETAPFDLDRRLMTLRSMMLPAARNKGIRLRLRLDPNVPPWIRAPEQAIHQILLNFLANAVKFTEQGGVTLRVLHGSIPGERPSLRFEVEDSGIGIPEHAHSRIFERFTQASGETRERYGGTGLGLSIARELTQLAGGRIGVASTPGKGSTFWCELPYEGAEEDDPGLPEDGFIVVFGDPHPAVELAERVWQAGLQSRAVSSPGEVIATIRRQPGRHAVLLTRMERPPDFEWLQEELERVAGTEPIDMVAVGSDCDHQALLAALPAEVPAAMLRRVLRAALAHPAVGEESPAGQEGQLQSARPARLLVAEDNRTNQLVIRQVLERAGHRVEVVEDGVQAVERLQSESFDAVLLDVNMPGMGGIEAVKMLRFTHPPNALPPIIALSADATEETRADCLAVGFSEYLTKPVHTAHLLQTVDRLIASRGGPKANEGDAGTTEPRRPPAAHRAVVVPHPAARQAAADTEKPALDRAKLDALAELDSGDGFFARVIREFLHDVDELVERLAGAAEEGDMRAFRDAAHALRSSSAHVGASCIFDHCLAWSRLDDHALAMRARDEVLQLRSLVATVHTRLAELAGLPDKASSDGAGREETLTGA